MALWAWGEFMQNFKYYIRVLLDIIHIHLIILQCNYVLDLSVALFYVAYESLLVIVVEVS